VKRIIGALLISLAALGISAAPAHADVPGIGSTICLELQLGYSPEQIAAQLHYGDPRWAWSQYLSTIYNTMGYCD
jgi:hypothetical protein